MASGEATRAELAPTVCEIQQSLQFKSATRRWIMTLLCESSASRMDTTEGRGKADRGLTSTVLLTHMLQSSFEAVPNFPETALRGVGAFD